MYWFPKKNRPKNGHVTIERIREDELEVAIAELEKRGYELVKKGVKNEINIEHQQTRSDHLTANLNSRRKQILQPIDSVKLYAIMKRKQVNM